MHRQSFLPGFPDGAVKVGKAVSILKKEGRVTHFVGGDNYFSHKEGDEKSWRFVIASLIGNDHVRACDVEASLHIPHRTLMNWMKQYRNEGRESSYRLAPTSGASVMTEEKRLECARLLAEGHSVAPLEPTNTIAQ